MLEGVSKELRQQRLAVCGFCTIRVAHCIRSWLLSSRAFPATFPCTSRLPGQLLFIWFLCSIMQHCQHGVHCADLQGPSSPCRLHWSQRAGARRFRYRKQRYTWEACIVGCGLSSAGTHSSTVSKHGLDEKRVDMINDMIHWLLNGFVHLGY